MSVDADHERLIWFAEEAVAVRPDGVDGGVVSGSPPDGTLAFPVHPCSADNNRIATAIGSEGGHSRADPSRLRNEFSAIETHY